MIVLYELQKQILSYLTIYERVISSDIIGQSGLHYYDFTSDDFKHKHLEDLFSCDNMDIHSEQMDLLTHLSIEYDDYYGYTIDDYIMDQYGDIEREKYNELRELTSFYSIVFTIRVIEYIEYHQPSLDYDPTEDIDSLENRLHGNVHQQVIDTFKNAFRLGIINVCCERCGSFGHHNVSPECPFYNKEYESIQIQLQLDQMWRQWVDKIIKKDEQEKKNTQLRPLLCWSCQVNKRKIKCKNNCCGSCCQCKKHT